MITAASHGAAWPTVLSYLGTYSSKIQASTLVFTYWTFGIELSSSAIDTPPNHFTGRSDCASAAPVAPTATISRLEIIIEEETERKYEAVE